ncbi:ATP-binding protein [Candidatus Woesearchaeota archaeon]|nr:ATP-binding protein [Candidatus Woesearchaeota archaeon]
MYIKRDLESKIRKFLKRKEILAILGTRRCGKTTLMRQIFKELKNAKFISFDDQEILRVFKEDINLFIKIYVEDADFLFIDEFQYAKEGGKQLKFIYDNHNIKIIISESSAMELSIQSVKYLVGRIFIFNLNPFSFSEFLKYKNEKLSRVIAEEPISNVLVDKIFEYYEEYLIYGGYPEVILSYSEDEKKEVLKNIHNTYLLREVKEILQISDDFKLVKLIKALALQVGSLINYSEISSLTGFEHKELAGFVNILKKTFICIESRPFFRNKRKEIVKSPKIFFIDSGFRNHVINNFQKLDIRTDRGSLNENFVAGELFKKDIQFNYWRTKAGAEVDFVIEKENKLIPIEVKTVLKSPRYGKSFKNFIEEYKSQEGFILSEKYYNKIKLDKSTIKFLPVFSISFIINI